MRSLLHSLLAGFVAAFPLFAGGRGLALFSLSAGQRQEWRLVVEAAQVATWRTRPPDLRLRRLAVAGLQVENGARERLQELAARAGTDPDTLRWALLDPQRKVIAFGDGSLSLDRVEAALREALGALPWDTLEAVLKAQPDHGEARLAYAEWALAQVGLFRGWGPPIQDYWTWAGSQGVVAEAQAALERLRKVPDWTSQVALATADEQELGFHLKRQAGHLADAIKAMTKDLVGALAGDPDHPRLQANAAFLVLLQDREGALRLQGDLEAIVPLPGQEWPPEPLLLAMAERYRGWKQWPELLGKCEAWSRSVDRLFLDRRSWERHLHREALLRALGTTARSWVEGWDILLPALESLRQESGGAYRELAQLALKGANFPDDRRFQVELGRQLARPTVPLPPRPEGLPRWRIEVQGKAALDRLRDGFDSHPGLLRWLPSEREFGLSPRPGWQLLLGALPSQGGGSALDLERLADALAAGRPARLGKVWERVLQDPESPGPRRQRIALLAQRMPVKAMESPLAEDLRRARLGVETEDWNLDENLWFAEAQRAIPLLEEHLRRWPMDAERWKALAFWSGFIPRHGGPAQLADELPTWQPGLAFRLCLPAELHEAVGKVLTERKAWGALRAWFEPAWTQLRELPRREARASNLARELAPVLEANLDRAFRELGLSGELRQLREAGRELASGR